MGNSFVEEYLQSLWCQNNGEPLVPVGPFVPNCFTGGYPSVQGYSPTVTPGTGDLSWEAWIKWICGYQRSSDWFILGGIVLDQGAGTLLDERANGRPETGVNGFGFNIEYHAPAGLNVFGYQEPTAGPWNSLWTHLACNYDRSGNMTLYINAELDATFTTAIDAVTLGANLEFRPFECSEVGWDAAPPFTDLPDAGAACDDTTHGWGNFTQAMILNGPMAYHNRLLTAAEIRDSYLRKYVQNIAAVTQILWDWREPAGVTGWSHDIAAMTSAIRMSGLTHLQCAAPEGPLGSVIVPDLSGNGNTLTIPTGTSYSSTQGAVGDGTANVRAYNAFVSDPFWR